MTNVDENVNEFNVGLGAPKTPEAAAEIEAAPPQFTPSEPGAVESDQASNIPFSDQVRLNAQRELRKQSRRPILPKGSYYRYKDDGSVDTNLTGDDLKKVQNYIAAEPHADDAWYTDELLRYSIFNKHNANDDTYERQARVEGQIPALMKAGFAGPDIAAWTAAERQRLSFAGFSADDIDEYFTGVKVPSSAPQSFIQRFLNGTAVGRVLKQFDVGANEAVGEEPALSPATEKFLDDAGFSKDSILGFAVHPLVESAARTLEIPGILVGGAGSAIAQGLEEAGVSQRQSHRFGADLGAFANIGLAVLGGPEGIAVQSGLLAGQPIVRPAGQPMGHLDSEHVGDGLPTAEDFMNAAQSLSPEEGWGPKVHRGEVMAPERITGEAAPQEGPIINGEQNGGVVPPYTAQKMLDRYEQSGVHPAESAFDAKTDIVTKQELLSDTPVHRPIPYRAFTTGVNIDRSFDVPYGAGISKDGKTVYVDSRVPETFRDPSGQAYDPAQFVIWHEEIEHAVMTGDEEKIRKLLGTMAPEYIDKMKKIQESMGANVPYERAHTEFANPLEKTAVESAGLDYNDYQKQWNTWLNETEHENADNPPTDLYDKPYAHDEEMIRNGGEDIDVSQNEIDVPSPPIETLEQTQARVESDREVQKLQPREGEAPEPYLSRVMDEIRTKPGANTGRLAKLLGPKLYGEPTNLAAVSLKEMFQNSFDGIKGAMEKGLITKGKIDIEMDPASRTVIVQDNGTGMSPEVLAKQFLEIAGTSKETTQASGGLGIAKMLFLFGNKDIIVTTLRDGTLSRLKTTGEQLFRALENPEEAPNITTEKISLVDRAKAKLTNTGAFPEGHGTRVEISVPKEYKDPSTGEMKEIKFEEGPWSHDVLQHSPLFSDIDVTFNGSKQWNIGSTFEHNKHTQFANVNFDWGTARIYVTKEKTAGGSWGTNVDVLSNGLWQFSTQIKKNPKEAYGDNLSRHFYIDVSPKVLPEEAGYPFDLNRQSFSKIAGEDFTKIFNYVSALYRHVDFAEGAQNYGNIEYLSKSGDKIVSTGKRDLVPPVPMTENIATHIKPGDQIEVKDGKLIVNNRAIPELTKEQLATSSIDYKKLTIPQDQIDPNQVMMHDNIDVPKVSKDQYGFETQEMEPITKLAREQFGDRFDNYAFSLGDIFLRLRNATVKLMEASETKYADLAKEAIGVSMDPEYYGVHTYVPFGGSFINIALGRYPDNPRAVGMGMVGTMIHELAHYVVSSHDAEFPAEMQKLIINYDLNPDVIDIAALKREAADVVESHKDIFDWLHEKALDSSSSPRGSRFKEAGAYQARDESTPRNVGGTGDAGGGESGLPARVEEGDGAAGESEGHGLVSGGGGGGVGPPAGPGGFEYGEFSNVPRNISPEEMAASRAYMKNAISVGQTPKAKTLTLNNFMYHIIDELYPVARAERLATKRAAESQDFNAQMTGTELLRLTSGSAGKVSHWLKYGTVDFNTYQTNGPSFKSIVGAYGNKSRELNELREFITAATAIHQDMNGLPTRINLRAARNIVERDGRIWGPVAKRMVEYNNNLVDYAFDGSLLTDKGRENLRGLNLTYAPYNMVMSLPERANYPRSMPQAALARMQESDKVIDPLETGIRNTHFLVPLAEMNYAKTVLLEALMGDEGLMSGGLPAIIEPREVAPFPRNDSTALAIRQIFNKNGIEPDEDLMDFLRWTHEGDKIDQGQVTIFKNGKKVSYLIDPDVAKVLNNLGRQESHIILRALGYFTRVKRVGIVLDPTFMVRHSLREPIYAMLTYENGLFTPLNFAEGLLHGIMHNLGVSTEAYQRALKSGGMHSSMIALDRNYLQEDLAALNAKTGFWSKRLNSLANPLVPLRALTESVLSASHLGAFIKAERKMRNEGMFTESQIPHRELDEMANRYVEQGMTPDEAEVQARRDLSEKYPPGPTKQQTQRLGFIARDTSVDNTRAGATMRSWNLISSFAVATVADTAKILQSAAKNPKKFIFLSTILATAALLNWWANKDDPKVRDAKQQKKNTNLTFPISGTHYTFNYPKPFGYGVVTMTTPEYIAQAIYDNDPSDLDGLAAAFGDNIFPNYLPDLFTTLAETALNRSSFTGASIVPRYAEELLPELQYSRYNTETSKALGKLIGAIPYIGETTLASPAMIENWVNGTLGTLGNDALRIIDFGLRKAGVVPDPIKPSATLADNIFIRSFVSRYPDAGTQPISDFMDDYKRRDMYYKSFMNRVQFGDPTATTIMQQFGGPGFFAKLDDIKSAIGRWSYMINTLTDKFPSMPGDQKRQLIDSWYLMEINAARMGNAMMKSFDKYAKAVPFKTSPAVLDTISP